MNLEADTALLKYFALNKCKIEEWFNVIAPETKTIAELESEIAELRSKNWRGIL